MIPTEEPGVRGCKKRGDSQQAADAHPGNGPQTLDQRRENEELKGRHDGTRREEDLGAGGQLCNVTHETGTKFDNRFHAIPERGSCMPWILLFSHSISLPSASAAPKSRLKWKIRVPRVFAWVQEHRKGRKLSRRISKLKFGVAETSTAHGGPAIFPSSGPPFTCQNTRSRKIKCCSKSTTLPSRSAWCSTPARRLPR